jgi:hypothetical protein
VIGILYNAIVHNMEFGQAYCKYFLKRNQKKLVMGFIHEFNIIYLFSIYITFYYETILILQGYGRPKNYGNFYGP